MFRKKNIKFIYNPFSGIGSKKLILRQIDQIIDTKKFDYDIALINHEGHAEELAREAAEKKYDIACAIGGDGTVNGVAKGLINTDTALAIIPGGSGNGLARHLHIPIDWKKALRLINECNVRKMDYGVVNLIPFFCTCGLGFDAFISKKFSETRVRGPLAYVEKMLINGLQFKPETYDIELRTVLSQDGSEQTIDVLNTKAFMLSVANASQFGNNAYIAPQASVFDGVLDVTIVKPFLPTEAAQMAIQLFSGTLDKNSRIETYKCKSVSIHRNKPGVIHFDGDPVETTKDVEIAIVPQGLWCVCPKDEGVKEVTQNIQSEIIDQFNLIVRQLRAPLDI